MPRGARGGPRALQGDPRRDAPIRRRQETPAPRPRAPGTLGVSPRGRPGGKPKNVKVSVGRPATERAAATADGPGTVRTGRFFGPCRTDHAVARIRDQGGSCITDQRQIFARPQPVEEEFDLPRFVVVVARDEACGEAEPGCGAAGRRGCPRRQSRERPRRTARARGDRSSRFPMGVATTKSVPRVPLTGSGVHSANRNPLAGLAGQRVRRRVCVLPDNGTPWTTAPRGPGAGSSSPARPASSAATSQGVCPPQALG